MQSDYESRCESLKKLKELSSLVGAVIISTVHSTIAKQQHHSYKSLRKIAMTVMLSRTPQIGMS
jgi:hypothetical protein